MISALLLLLLWAPNEPQKLPERYKIRTQQAGPHQLTFDMLSRARHSNDPLLIETMALHEGDTPVRFHVIDENRDRHFGPGETMLFLVSRLKGALGYHHEYSETNAVMLTIGEAGTLMVPAQPGTLKPNQSTVSMISGQLRAEEDVLLMRFASRRHEAHEVWYWEKLSCIDDAPFVYQFDLPQVARFPTGDAELRLGMRGFSRIFGYEHEADHNLEIKLNGNAIAVHTWDGKEPVEMRFSFPHRWLLPENNKLTLRIPQRRGNEDQILVDVSILNWIDLRYQRQAIMSAEEPALVYTPSNHRGPLVLETQAEDVFLFSMAGVVQRLKRAQPLGKITFPKAKANDVFWISPAKGLHNPLDVTPTSRKDWRAASNQADYLMISHPSLMDAVAPLATFHRERGMNVTLVNVFDLYDQFNGGVTHPDAIRGFLEHTYSQWRKPVPRFVLLVGDASWDFRHDQADQARYIDDVRRRKSDQFVHIPVTEYDEILPPGARNLVPTYLFFNQSGHSASDNQFVAFGAKDGEPRPAMAIGRLPLAIPAEVTQVVDKTIAYIKSPKVGPHRRNILWITNEESPMQRNTNRIAADVSERGWVSTKIFPQPDEKDNSGNTAAISKALNSGQDLVYFLGHGGRFIWRTGPPNYTKNHDLFTLDNLDQLEPNPNPPVVVSFTCFSAPFDHPSADSIGEKFLRMPDKGAVAVIGASWRNAPSRPFITDMMLALTEAPTVGEALIMGKQGVRNDTLLQTYNLLGDPAVPRRIPPKDLQVSLSRTAQGSWQATAQMANQNFSGQAIFDLVQKDGTPLLTQTTAVSAGKAVWHFDLPADTPPPTALTAYTWNDSLGQDALGRIAWPKESDSATSGN